MYRKLPLNGLRAFEAASRQLSFARAADDLGVTPAAVSYQIRALEERLNVKLFVRSNREVSLTEAGILMLSGVRTGFEELQRAVERVDRRSRSSNVVVVNTGPAFAAKWLVPRLVRFMDRHPDVDLRVSANRFTVDLSSDQADVAIRYNMGDNDSLVADWLMDETLLPLCSPDLVRGQRPLEDPSQLTDHTLIHDDSLVQFWPDMPGWTEWFERAGSPCASTLPGPHFDHADHAIDAAISGSGVVLGRRSMAERDLELGRLVAPFDVELPLPGAFYSVTTRRKATEPGVQAFREWLLDEIRARN